MSIHYNKSSIKQCKTHTHTYFFSLSVFFICLLLFVLVSLCFICSFVFVLCCYLRVCVVVVFVGVCVVHGLLFIDLFVVSYLT